MVGSLKRHSLGYNLELKCPCFPICVAKPDSSIILRVQTPQSINSSSNPMQYTANKNSIPFLTFFRRHSGDLGGIRGLHLLAHPDRLQPRSSIQSYKSRSVFYKYNFKHRGVCCCPFQQCHRNLGVVWNSQERFAVNCSSARILWFQPPSSVQFHHRSTLLCQCAASVITNASEFLFCVCAVSFANVRSCDFFASLLH